MFGPVRTSGCLYLPDRRLTFLKVIPRAKRARDVVIVRLVAVREVNHLLRKAHVSHFRRNHRLQSVASKAPPPRAARKKKQGKFREISARIRIGLDRVQC